MAIGREAQRLSLSRFGALLKRYRVAEGLTQEDLAERAGLSVRGISDLERGKALRPQRETLRALVKALHLSSRDRAQLEAAAEYHRTAAAVLDPLGIAPPGALMVGRDRELTALERHLSGEGPPVLVIAGEPGIGKSRLLQEAARQAGGRGYTVLHGGGQRGAGQDPYAPMLDALARSLAGLSPSHLRTALAGCGWLPRLLPELVETVSVPFPAGTLPATQERRLVFAAVAHYLGNIAGPAGTLLVLDDLQWAGPDALDLLVSLVQPDSRTPVRILGAYRDTEVDHNTSLLALLADLAERYLVSRLRLGPLEEADAAELLDQCLQRREVTITPDIKQQIIQRTGGVPFFLVSRLHDLEGGDDRAAVPWNVTQSIGRRVARLGPAARNLLAAAAIMGREVRQSTLERMVALSEEELIQGLDTACRAGLLVVHGTAAYRFAHDVVREAVEGALGEAERTRLHRKAGEVLEELPQHTIPITERAALLAWHFLEGDDPERGLRYSLLAGDGAAAVFAYGEAEVYYRRALTMATDAGDTVSAATIREKLGALLHRTARWLEAMETLESAAGVYRDLRDTERERRVILSCAWIQLDRGRPEEAIRLARSMLAALEAAPPSRMLAEFYLVLASALAQTDSPADALDAAARATEIARDIGDDVVAAAAEERRGLVLLLSGAVEQSGPVLERAVALAEATGRTDTLLRTMSNLSSVLLEPGAAVAYVRRALLVAEQQNDLVTLANLIEELVQRGHVLEARAHLEPVLARFQTAGLPPASLYPLFHVLGRVAMLTGDWRAARRHLQEAILLAEPGGVPWPRWMALSDLAWLDIWQRKPEDALARLAPEREVLDAWGMFPAAVRAEARLQLGAVDRAEDEIQHVLSLHGRYAKRGRIMLLCAEGMVETRRHQWDRAEQAFEEALALERTLPTADFKAYTLYQFGLMCREQGERERARVRLEEARAVFQQMSTHPCVDWTEQALQSL